MTSLAGAHRPRRLALNLKRDQQRQGKLSTAHSYRLLILQGPVQKERQNQVLTRHRCSPAAASASLVRRHEERRSRCAVDLRAPDSPPTVCWLHLLMRARHREAEIVIRGL